MANYSLEIDTLIRAYFRGKLTEIERKNFENRLQIDTELSEAFTLEQENRHFFRAYKYYKLQEAEAMIQALEKVNPLTENIDNQPNESHKKWFGLGFLLLIFLGSLYYFYAFNTTDSSEKNPIASLLQDTNTVSGNSKDSLANNIIVQGSSPKNSEAVKMLPKNTVFDDSLKSYLLLEKIVKQSQNDLISLLQNNLSINHIVIDTLKALTKCDHEKNNVSLGPPKFRLLSDSLVLDSIRIMQVFPPPPQNISALKSQKETLMKWETLGIARKNEAFERNKALQAQFKRFSRELKSCRE